MLQYVYEGLEHQTEFLIVIYREDEIKQYTQRIIIRMKNPDYSAFEINSVKLSNNVCF